MDSVAIDVEGSNQEIPDGEASNHHQLIPQISETGSPSDNDIEMESLNDNPQGEARLKTLLNLLQNDDFVEFEKSLTKALGSGVDINHQFPEHENKTLLDIACSGQNKAAFVELLLHRGAEVNSIGKHGAAPIHLAILNPYDENAENEIVKLLVDHDPTNIQQPNDAGETAFNLAALQNRKGVIKLLLERQALDIEAGKKSILPKISYHDPIDDMYISEVPPERGESYAGEETLLSLLLQRNFEAFRNKANVTNVQFPDSDLGYTYLQYSCIYGLQKFVELLLDLNVNPNETGESADKRTPIVIAACKGYYDIVQLLLNTGIITYDNIEKENILHYIMHGFTFSKNCSSQPDDSGQMDHTKCLEVILNNVPESQLKVDSTDKIGNTPLYYAIVYDNLDMIFLLLERGAYIGARNRSGQVLVKLMRPATLEFFLNSSIYTEVSSEGNRTITFNYDLLTCTLQELNLKRSHETKLLVALSQKDELKRFLNHPFSLIYLDFKWHIIMKNLYFINILFYSLFIASLSIYLLAPLDTFILSYTTLAFNIIISLKIVMKLIIYLYNQKYKNFINPEYLMEISLSVIIYIIFFDKCILVCKPVDVEGCRDLLAVAAIMLSYTQLMVLILSHPTMCVYIKMFNAVAWHALKSLLSYLILILAFAFSFSILFKNKKETNKKDENFFKDIPNSVFKTLVMLTGEFELSSMREINKDFDSIRMIFVLLFIFLIPIVLFNLLTAIAVNDIQGIKRDAELVSHAARAESIVHTEEIILAVLSFFGKLNDYYNMLFRRNPKKPSYIHDKLQYYKLCIGVTGNSRQIIFHMDDQNRHIGHVQFGKTQVDRATFSIFSSTAQSIQEKLSTEASKNKNADLQQSTAEGTQEAAAAQKRLTQIQREKRPQKKTAPPAKYRKK